MFHLKLNLRRLNLLQHENGPFAAFFKIVSSITGRDLRDSPAAYIKSAILRAKSDNMNVFSTQGPDWEARKYSAAFSYLPLA